MRPVAAVDRNGEPAEQAGFRAPADPREAWVETPPPATGQMADRNAIRWTIDAAIGVL
jgi:hypothetical protein